METTKLSSLKLACNQFYMNIGLDQPKLTDQEFDQLRKEYESEGGRIRDLVDWDDAEFVHDDSDSLTKIIAESNDLVSETKSYLTSLNPEDYYLNYKYDGASIKAYYENGKLKSILSTPHLEIGIVRTKSFWKLFPHEVNPAIKSIQGEVLVDANVYGQLARNKANGLTNSKDRVEEVESEAFIRVYRIGFVDGDNNYQRQKLALDDMIQLDMVRTRVCDIKAGETKLCKDRIFAPAVRFNPEECPKDPIIQENDVKFQVDGVVAYSNKELMGIKFYFTEYADVEVLEVCWDRKPNGSFAPVLNIEQCTLNEKEINYVTASGVPNLMDRKMGKGAKVRVILANMTIPKVVDTTVPSEDYQWPTCSCGHKCGPEDILGAMLKCTETTECEWKVRNWLAEFAQSVVWNDLNKRFNSFEDYFKENFFECLSYLYIDRWNPESKISVTSDEERNFLYQELFQGIKTDNLDYFKNLIFNNFNFTELSERNCEINISSTFKVFKSLQLNWNYIDQTYVDNIIKGLSY